MYGSSGWLEGVMMPWEVSSQGPEDTAAGSNRWATLCLQSPGYWHILSKEFLASWLQSHTKKKGQGRTEVISHHFTALGQLRVRETITAPAVSWRSVLQQEVS